MANLRLRLICGQYDRVEPLMEGRVKPKGVSLTTEYSPPAETFWKLMKGEGAEVSEMSTSFLLMAQATGKTGWTAIPVFPMRYFFHTDLFVNIKSRIKEPQDLVGKKLGVAEYAMSLALWLRGILQHEFDVDPRKIKWVLERKGKKSMGGVFGFEPPKDVSIEYVPNNKNVNQMLIDGEIEAAFPYPMKTVLDKSPDVPIKGNPMVRRLFPDPIAEAVRYFRKTGFFPINHAVIIQNGVIRKHPWLAESLFDAFQISKRITQKRIEEEARFGYSSLVFARDLKDLVKETFGDDPYPYGFKANKKILSAMAQYSYEQGLSPKRVEVEDLFHESMLKT